MFRLYLGAKRNTPLESLGCAQLRPWHVDKRRMGHGYRNRGCHRLPAREPGQRGLAQLALPKTGSNFMKAFPKHIGNLQGVPKNKWTMNS